VNAELALRFEHHTVDQAKVLFILNTVLSALYSGNFEAGRSQNPEGMTEKP
jgi:hypothetical protein